MYSIKSITKEQNVIDIKVPETFKIFLTNPFIRQGLETEIELKEGQKAPLAPTKFHLSFLSGMSASFRITGQKLFERSNGYIPFLKSKEPFFTFNALGSQKLGYNNEPIFIMYSSKLHLDDSTEDITKSYHKNSKVYLVDSLLEKDPSLRFRKHQITEKWLVDDWNQPSYPIILDVMNKSTNLITNVLLYVCEDTEKTKTWVCGSTLSMDGKYDIERKFILNSSMPDSQAMISATTVDQGFLVIWGNANKESSKYREIIGGVYNSYFERQLDVKMFSAESGDNMDDTKECINLTRLGMNSSLLGGQVLLSWRQNKDLFVKVYSSDMQNLLVKGTALNLDHPLVDHSLLKEHSVISDCPSIIPMTFNNEKENKKALQYAVVWSGGKYDESSSDRSNIYAQTFHVTSANPATVQKSEDALMLNEDLEGDQILPAVLKHSFRPEDFDTIKEYEDSIRADVKNLISSLKLDKDESFSPGLDDLSQGLGSFSPGLDGFFVAWYDVTKQQVNNRLFIFKRNPNVDDATNDTINNTNTIKEQNETMNIKNTISNTNQDVKITDPAPADSTLNQENNAGIEKAAPNTPPAESIRKTILLTWKNLSTCERQGIIVELSPDQGNAEFISDLIAKNIDYFQIERNNAVDNVEEKCHFTSFSNLKNDAMMDYILNSDLNDEAAENLDNIIQIIQKNDQSQDSKNDYQNTITAITFDQESGAMQTKEYFPKNNKYNKQQKSGSTSLSLEKFQTSAATQDKQQEAEINEKQHISEKNRKAPANHYKSSALEKLQNGYIIKKGNENIAKQSEPISLNNETLKEFFVSAFKTQVNGNSDSAIQNLVYDLQNEGKQDYDAPNHEDTVAAHNHEEISQQNPLCNLSTGCGDIALEEINGEI